MLEIEDVPINSNVGTEFKEDEEDVQLKTILIEHTRLIPDDPEFNDGMTLIVSITDEDDKHIAEHSRFLKERKSILTDKSKTRLQKHIQKHIIQKAEKLNLELKKDKNMEMGLLPMELKNV